MFTPAIQLADNAGGTQRFVFLASNRGSAGVSSLHLLAFATVMLATTTGAPQPPCDLVPEQELPNCHFTQRSNYALHGHVHTVRVITRELSPDPGTRGFNAHKAPKLFIQAPGAWVVFSADGDLIENSSSLSQDGSPLNPARERRTTEGSKTVVISGTTDDPEAFRTEKSFASDGELIEEFEYQHEKLFSHHVQERDSTTGSTEDTTYDADGNVMSYSSERVDKRGRAVEWIVFDHGRLVLHQRDSYDQTSDGDDGSALISRAWFDKNGLRFREITLRNGEATSSWQRPDCDELCGQNDGVGLDFSFDHSISWEFQPDGSLLTTIEHHKGRYGSIDNNDAEVFNQDGKVLERIAYRYVRDQFDNWTERTVSISDPATGQMMDVRLDKRDLTYY